MLTIQIIFWTGLAAVFTTYFVYPVVLMLLAPFRRPHTMKDETPSITLVVSAFNEESVIREKIENSLSLDYPLDRLEIMVISDGSDDATDLIVSEFADKHVVLCRQETRQGKSSGLTRFVPDATGEILIFSDANSIYEPQALRKLVRHFADPGVGFSVGHQRYVEEDSPASTSESLYWRYETSLKVRESQVGSVVCGDGAIMAVRAELFEPLRADDINDFYIPLRIVTRGFRGIFDPEAVCYERTAEDFSGEFRRKVRIVHRSLRAVLRVPQACNPVCVGWFAGQLLVHKVLRWFVPFFLLGMIASSCILAAQGGGLFLVAVAGQTAFYGLALLHAVHGLRRFKLIYIAYYFCLVNLAAAIGVTTLFFGRRIVTWNPQRGATHEPAGALGRQSP